MKKLCAFLLMALLMVPVWAGADDLVLPDPGYYFGREYNGSYIEFDEYPYAEYNAYVSLLVNQYGMQIMSAYSGESDEFYFLQMPGTEYTRTFIWCYQYSDGCGIEAYFDNGISLEPLDVYGQRPDAEKPAEEKSAAKGQIAWDDGRMIADPGDFLGYEIAVTDILDMTDYKYGGYYFTRYYEEIDMADILKYIDALDASPYFKKSSTSDAKSASYRIVNFMYTGPDSDLAALCKDSHRNKRTCDLYIHIDYRNRERSTFRITSYPGFTVDSVDYVPEPTPGPIPDDRQDCIFCDNGSCDNCGGSGFVYQYAAGYKDTKKKVDCSSCINGRCSFCDGRGWR